MPVTAQIWGWHALWLKFLVSGVAVLMVMIVKLARLGVYVTSDNQCLHLGYIISEFHWVVFLCLIWCRVWAIIMTFDCNFGWLPLSGQTRYIGWCLKPWFFIFIEGKIFITPLLLHHSNALPLDYPQNLWRLSSLISVWVSIYFCLHIRFTHYSQILRGVIHQVWFLTIPQVVPCPSMPMWALNFGDRLHGTQPCPTETLELVFQSTLRTSIPARSNWIILLSCFVKVSRVLLFQWWFPFLMPIFRFQGSQAFHHCQIASTSEVFQISIQRLLHTPRSSERHHFSFLEIKLFLAILCHPGTKHNRAIHQFIWHTQIPIHCWQSVLQQSPHDVRPPWEMANGLALLGYRIHMSVMQLMCHQQWVQLPGPPVLAILNRWLRYAWNVGAIGLMWVHLMLRDLHILVQGALLEHRAGKVCSLSVPPLWPDFLYQIACIPLGASHNIATGNIVNIRRLYLPYFHWNIWEIL